MLVCHIMMSFFAFNIYSTVKSDEKKKSYDGGSNNSKDDGNDFESTVTWLFKYIFIPFEKQFDTNTGVTCSATKMRYP